VAFLLFAAGMMLFHSPRERSLEVPRGRMYLYGGAVGAIAGFLGGLLGVGGGNFIVPVLIWLGVNPKKASATTSFIVIFSSLAGFLGRASLGSVSASLLGVTAVASALGAMVGAEALTPPREAGGGRGAARHRGQDDLGPGDVMFSAARPTLRPIIGQPVGVRPWTI
jgi:uncharacterized membrane protein YfcA